MYGLHYHILAISGFNIGPEPRPGALMYQQKYQALFINLRELRLVSGSFLEKLYCCLKDPEGVIISDITDVVLEFVSILL